MSQSFRLNLRVKAGLASLVALAMLALPVPAHGTDTSSTVTVIVQQSGSGVGAKDLTKSLGGTVDYDLDIIDGFAATIPASAFAALEASSHTSFVTQDAPVHMHGLLGDALGEMGSPVDNVSAPTGSELADLTTVKSVKEVAEPLTSVLAPQPPPARKAPSASDDRPDENVFHDVIDTNSAYEQGARGQGTTVALIDTGVAKLADLEDSIVPVANPDGTTDRCVDLSGEDNCEDSYGHGTFLAGLITGNGAASGGKFAGVAPDAKLLSLKIAGRDGSASVGKILYAIQWVTNHKDEYGIDVLNLALGTDSTQSYRYDPLNYAVQRAWKSGVTVVVSAGNRGPDARTISKPADDPFVITAGATDDMATVDLGDDSLPNFSSKGPTAADGLTKPDLTAPGARVISLRSPGSAIETQFPGGGVDSTYRRGSGTSQSAAVISGAAAVLLSAHPNLGPDEVKYALTNSTNKAAATDRNSVGSGTLDIGRAVVDLPKGKANQNVAVGRGNGSLERSQGSIGLVAKDKGKPLGRLRAVVPIRGLDQANPSGGSWYETGWYGGSWYGGSWYGGSWYGGSWYGGSWYGGSWYGAWD